MSELNKCVRGSIQKMTKNKNIKIKKKEETQVSKNNEF